MNHLLGRIGAQTGSDTIQRIQGGWKGLQVSVVNSVLSSGSQKYRAVHMHLLVDSE
jgi:hypothetical protein